jgi:hypothetical protein
MSISDLCQEQFSIIRQVTWLELHDCEAIDMIHLCVAVAVLQVFPSQSVSKVTKMLITRIFNDPAFGIQVHLDDSCLCAYNAS